MDIPLSRILGHGIVALIGWLLGTILAGGVGYAFARVLRFAFHSRPGLRRASVLLPWRTVLIGLFMLASSPIVVVFIVARLGLGERSGAAWAVLAMFLLAFSFIVTILFEHWFPQNLIPRLVAAVRTLAVASVGLVAGIGSFGGGGLGHIALMSLKLLEYDVAVKTYLIIVGLTLILDILLGIPQLLIIERISKSQASFESGAG